MATPTVKYPEIEVQLTGRDGNAFVILGFVTAAMRRARLPQETINEFLAEAQSGDYDHLLRTCLKWVNVA